MARNRKKQGLSARPVDRAFTRYAAMPCHSFPQSPEQQKARDFEAGWYACLEYVQQVEHIRRKQLDQMQNIGSGGTG